MSHYELDLKYFYFHQSDLMSIDKCTNDCALCSLGQPCEPVVSLGISIKVRELHTTLLDCPGAWLHRDHHLGVLIASSISISPCQNV